jgi:hypothetical protein
MLRTLRRQLGVVIFYMLLAALALYWLLFHSATHIPGEHVNDYFHFHWSYWWIRHALTTPGLNVYETNFVMFPNVSNLALHTWTPFFYPLWALTEPLIGTLQAFDVIFITALTLTGYSFFLLARDESVPPGLALVGGVVLELTPSIMFAVIQNTLHYMGFFWLPINILIWKQVVRRVEHRWQGILWALLLGLAFFGTLMADYQYAIYLVLLLLPYGVATLIRAKTASLRIRLIMLGIVSIILILALFWTVGPLRYLLAFDRSTLAPPPAENVHVIPFPIGFFARFDKRTESVVMGTFAMPATILTVLASLTVLRGQIQNRRRWFWLALSILPLMLAAGAYITILGQQIPMPYKIVHVLLGGLFRSADRFGTVFLIPAMIYFGLTWGPLLAKRIHWKLAVVGAILVFVMWDARTFIPIPIQTPVQHYSFYDQIGQERGKPYDDEVVLEVPVAAGSGENWVGELKNLAFQFYGMTHGKRMVNGLIARVPTSYFMNMRTDDPMLSWLGQRRLLDSPAVKKQLRERIFNWPIGYIVIHQDMIGLNGPTNQEIIGYLNSLPDLLCPYTVEGAAVVYRTAWHPDGCPLRTPPEIQSNVYQIDLGVSGDERYIGWGWHWAEVVSGVTLRWTGEYPQTQLYVDLPPGSYDISLSAQAFWQPRRLKILVNGQPAKLQEKNGETAIISTDKLTPVTFHIPSSVIGNGRHTTLMLEYDGWIVPETVGQGDDARKLAIAVDWIRFKRSAGGS